MGLPARDSDGLGLGLSVAAQTTSSHEANGYIAKGFSRESSRSMNRNEESSIPGITAVPSIPRHAESGQTSFQLEASLSA